MLDHTTEYPWEDEIRNNYQKSFTYQRSKIIHFKDDVAYGI